MSRLRNQFVMMAGSLVPVELSSKKRRVVLIESFQSYETLAWRLISLVYY